MTEYLTLPAGSITLAQAAEAITWLQGQTATLSQAAIDREAAHTAALQAALDQVTALQAKIAAYVAPDPEASPAPAPALPAKVQVLHRQPSITVPMNILNVENTGEMLTVYVN